MAGPWDRHGEPFEHRGRSDVDYPTWLALEAAERDAGFTFRVTQGRHRGTAASAGTHDGYGVVDLHAHGLGRRAINQMVLSLRKVGTTAWHRVPGQGFPVEHVHFNLIDHPDQSPAAQRQVAQYRAGENGLAGHGPDDGPDGYHHWDWPSYWAAHHGDASTPAQHSPVGPSQTTMQQVGIHNPPANSVHDSSSGRAPFTLSLKALQMAAAGQTVTGQYLSDVQHALGSLRVLLPGVGHDASFEQTWRVWETWLEQHGQLNPNQDPDDHPDPVTLIALAKRCGYKAVLN